MEGRISVSLKMSTYNKLSLIRKQRNITFDNLIIHLLDG